MQKDISIAEHLRKVAKEIRKQSKLSLQKKANFIKIVTGLTRLKNIVKP